MATATPRPCQTDAPAPAPDEIRRLINLRVDMDDASWRALFRGWVREQIDRTGRSAAGGADGG